MNLNVVFTGPAVMNDGKIVTRRELTQACVACGITIQSSVRKDTNFLVASREDTVKAQNAAMRGLAVMPYESFIASFLSGVELTGAGKPDPFTDVVKIRGSSREFQGQEQLGLLDVL